MTPNLVREAEALLALDPVAAEFLVEQRTAAAIRGWRLDEATFWQRVRIRSRMLRARAGGKAFEGKEKPC